MNSPRISQRCINRKAIVAGSLAVWFVPTCFLLPQLVRSGIPPLQMALFFPMLNGFPLAATVASASQAQGLFWPIGEIISIALPLALVVLALRAPRWRWVVLGAGFLVSCALSTAMYWMFRA